MPCGSKSPNTLNFPGEICVRSSSIARYSSDDSIVSSSWERHESEVLLAAQVDGGADGSCLCLIEHRLPKRTRCSDAYAWQPDIIRHRVGCIVRSDAIMKPTAYW
jgi:hypothetical protein